MRNSHHSWMTWSLATAVAVGAALGRPLEQSPEIAASIHEHYGEAVNPELLSMAAIPAGTRLLQPAPYRGAGARRRRPPLSCSSARTLTLDGAATELGRGPSGLLVWKETVWCCSRPRSHTQGR